MNTIIHQVDQANKVADTRWSLGQSYNNPLIYIATIIPPKNSVYNGGIFFMEIHFPNGFPVYPPRLLMTTKIYHPNISQTAGYVGKIYVEILYSDWVSTMTVSKLMEYVYSVFTKPDLDPLSICNSQAGDMYQTNREEFDRTAKEWTAKYASKF
uniref:E2 ubiquitin-conjugating enzyme n=1 Tax=Marseillevirus LCMAC202 TaxID=2506606 RepID=A0A481YXI8_9VIRU|nr:MAG: ubiquitin-conjugating enzyme E2 [Marseillevirus LCMAC202]